MSLLVEPELQQPLTDEWPAEVELIPETLESEWLDLQVTTIGIGLLEPSAPAKVRLALAKLTRSIIPPS